ncbi:MAG: AAA family ATPase [Chloroflexi bacterium]|nr:AAA family ATPase [Chloroflexota bacterium]
MFDHEIPLNQDERITIVHGPNGVGKTVIMEMVDDLLLRNYEVLSTIPFDQIRIEFDRGETLVVEKHIDTNRFLFQYDDCTGTQFRPFEPVILDKDSFIRFVEETCPILERIQKGKEVFWMFKGKAKELDGKLVDIWGDVVDELFVGRSGFFDWFYDQIRHSDFRDHWSADEIKLPSNFDQRPRWVAEISQTAGTSLIQVDRLLGEADDGPMFNSDSNKGLEGVYWVLHPRPAIVEFAESFHERMDFALDQVEDLKGLPLLNQIKKKFKLLQEVINERFLFKSLQIRNRKLMFVADCGNEIPLAALSSGEQQLLVLYYQLLFETQPDTLVMIDEPELSMNVVWQRNFLKDIEKIIELCKFDVIIATHSPMIIHDKWDWMVPLGEKMDD